MIHSTGRPQGRVSHVPPDVRHLKVRRGRASTVKATVAARLAGKIAVAVTA